MTLRSSIDFKSLLDAKYEEDLSALTEADWRIINSDPENLVYEPEDVIISDPYLASIVNSERQVQVGSHVYQYAGNGIYIVDAGNYDLLTEVGSGPVDDPRITVYKPTVPSSNSTPKLSGNLKLSNGVTIPSSNIRDLNYKEKGDANAITEFWTNLFGSYTAAIQKFSSNRHMVVAFYDQDYYIYKNIGIKAKMQKKVLGIWWKCNAQEIRVGWEAMELTESYNVFPYANPLSTNYIGNLYPELKVYEQRMPVWMSKDFPFANGYCFFTVPYVNYDVTTSNLNQLYKSALSAADKGIKQWMKSENKTTTPANLGFVGLASETTMRYLIGPNEDGNMKKNSLEKKFLSEWFGGTYIINYATDTSFKTSKFSVTIKGNNTKLGRGSVYGAVKYDGKWLAARILKSE